MKKKIQIKKLSLSKERVAILNQMQLTKLVGGYGEGTKGNPYTKLCTEK